MKLLAIDQGSLNLGLAAFEDGKLLPNSARRIRARGEGWAMHMRSIALQLREHLDPRTWSPDVIAIEGIALQRGPRANPRTLATMGMTRGYLVCFFDELYPLARVIEINPQRVRSAMGAPRRRAAAKQHIGWAVEALTGTDPGNEDARDAIAIGLAALEQLRVEDWEAKAKGERSEVVG